MAERDDSMDESSFFFECGKSRLLSGDLYSGLRNYSKGMQLSHSEKEMIEALESINEVGNLAQSVGFHFVRKILLLGIAVKFEETDAGRAALAQIKETSSPCKVLKKPIVIVAGGSSAGVEAKIRKYEQFILRGFHNFNGTIISGGTTSGISRIASDIQQRYPTAIRTVGYLPKKKLGLVDKRYGEIRFTDAQGFSPRELLQYWIDIVSSGIKAQSVSLIGINGGRISAIEYRVALALAARVAIIKESGMEADRLLSDKNWNSNPNLFVIQNDASAIQSFLQGSNDDLKKEEVSLT
jgi:hypothetical protein